MKNYLYGIAVFALLFLYGCDSQTTQEPAELSPTELSSEPNAEANAPDTVFVNGKILTVDESFSVVDALAVDGDRIVALGDSATIGALAGDDTNVIDLGGKTVIPGLIDNHMHFVRAGQKWHLQARIDGVTDREEALAIIAAKAASMEPGEWLMVQGGWYEAQFSDGRPGFTLEELDAAAPNNPLFLQITYVRVYANSLALEAVGVDPAEGVVHTGPVMISPRPPYGLLNEQMPEVSRDQIAQNIRDVMSAFNRAGLTTVYDVGRPPEGDIDMLREMSEADPLDLRVWHTLKYEAYNMEDADAAISLINSTAPNDRNDYVGLLGIGEHVFLPFFDLPGFKDVYSDEILTEFGRISRVAAENGYKINEHTLMDQTINSAMDEWERINEDIALAPLRWTLEHLIDMQEDTIKRAKALGLTTAVHGVAMTMPAALQPPMREMQDLGLIWGLGSDASIVAHYQPFITLGWAVSGKTITGVEVTDAPVTREEALVAHTRSNAYLLHKENDIGSLEIGKFADLVVLDKDYMTVPEEDIFHIESLLTMVDGRIVYDVIQ